jgi:uncharacterized protein (TIGR02145 family)
LEISIFIAVSTNKEMRRPIFVFLAILATAHTYAQVGLGTNSPQASAQLDVSSTSKGFLPPRMTHAQKTAIASPATGLTLWCTDCGLSGEMQVYNGSAWTNMVGGTASPAFVCGTSTVTFTYNGVTVTYGTVSRAYGGSTGTKCWLDRNLGATQMATSSTDAAAYGDLFQWGRGADGHQIINSASTTTLSSTDAPGNSTFIKVLSPNTPNDWRNPQNNNLWQGVNGINNPCPNGFRLPSSIELNAERATWSSNNSAGAFASPLKLPMTIGRNSNDAGLFGGESYGYYWSSTVSGTRVQKLYFRSIDANIDNNIRADGMSVRCIKD